MNNPLTDLLPSTARKYFYAALSLAAIVITALQIAGIDIDTAAKVITYLSGVFGAVAASNTSASVPASDYEGQHADPAG